MTFHTIAYACKSFFTDLFNGDSKVLRSHLRYAALILAFIGLGAISYAGYSWYNASRERMAEKDFSSYVQQYYRALSAPQSAAWDQLASLFDVGYVQHRSSELGPYFLAFQAEALLQQNKYQEALDVLKNLLSALPESSPFYALFRVKYNLILLDQPEHSGHQAALEALREIGSDKTNSAFEGALFYLGRYYFAHHDLEKARAFWQELRATAVDENPSPLIQEVDEYLGLIG
jgi:tetratricopeptide (TPR) repeat protein